MAMPQPLARSLDSYRFLNRGHMNGNGVLKLPRIAAGQGNHQGDTGSSRGFDDQPVAAAQAAPRQPQSAELVVFVWIRPGEIKDTLRIAAQYLRQAFFKVVEVLLVPRAVGQADVKGTPRLPHRVIQLLMHREGEHARIGFEDERRPVSMMDVQVDDGEALQSG